MNIARKALDIVLPPRCVVSGDEVDEQGMLSPKIWTDLRFIADPQCSCCGLPFDYEVEESILCASCIEDRPSFEQARSALVYDDHSRHLVLRFKHADQTHSVLAFVPWLMRSGAELIEKADLIMPVPLHRWRLLKRRYNQAAILALALSKETQLSCETNILRRVRSTPSQGHLKPKERAKNVKNAFEIFEKDASKVEEKNILLIDDVYTTGSTAEECTKALLKAGAKSVYVLTLARVVR